MLSTNYVPGTPNWVDLGTTDIDGAAAFYGALFGWQFQSAGPDAGGYGMLTLEGKTVAAVGPLMEPGVAPSWTIYFETENADATADAVKQVGGVVRAAPFDVFTAGRMGQFTDPAGARFAVWQPGQTRGLEAVNDPGRCAGPSCIRPIPPQPPRSIRRFSAGSPRTYRWATSTTR